MPIHHAVLGLLAEGPSYGYELRASFERAIGPQWGELNIGHVYQVLDRLVRDGLATAERVSQADRPDKVVYELTPAGREELERWLDEPVIRRSGFRDDVFLKLLVASRDGAERLRHVARVQRERYLGELATLAELRQRHEDDALLAVLLEAAVLHTEASLRVVELASERATEIVTGARPLAVPGAEKAARSNRSASGG